MSNLSEDDRIILKNRRAGMSSSFDLIFGSSYYHPNHYAQYYFKDSVIIKTKKLYKLILEL